MALGGWECNCWVSYSKTPRSAERKDGYLLANLLKSRSVSDLGVLWNLEYLHELHKLSTANLKIPRAGWSCLPILQPKDLGYTILTGEDKA